MMRPLLPTYYYLDHFTEMMSAVAKTYASILAPEHHDFIARFQNLSRDAQCLLIRMVNRRGSIFNRASLRYAEIADIAAAFDELTEMGCVRSLGESDYGSFLACLSKATLLQGAKGSGIDGYRSSWPKPKLIEWFLDCMTFERASVSCEADAFVVLDNLTSLQFLLFLYFGKTEDDLKRFALRDLGVMPVNKAASVSARFSDGSEALACFHYSRVLDMLEQKTLAAFQAAIVAIFDSPTATTDYVWDLRSSAACQTGQFFEKRGDRERAIQLYRAGNSPACHERLVRVLYANGDKASAEELLRRLIDDPASDDEYLFATDFYARKFGGQRTGACTELLRSGRTVIVDDVRRGNPEAGVAAVMRREG